MGLILMWTLNETKQLAMANSVCRHGHVLRREDGHVLRRALDLRMKVKGRQKITWNKQVDDESMSLGISGEDALCRSNRIVGVIPIATRLR